MKRILLSLCSLVFLVGSLWGQKYLTRTGHIGFFSEAPVENIEAHHHQVTSLLNTTDGQLVFSLLLQGFQFEKALMQEHFNEKYVESERFPKASFKGKISNLQEINFEKTGTYETRVEGSLTLHGVTQTVETTGTLEVLAEGIKASSDFEIVLADYQIKIPSVVADNIAETVQISVSMDYQPFKNTKK